MIWRRTWQILLLAAIVGLVLACKAYMDGCYERKAAFCRRIEARQRLSNFKIVSNIDEIEVGIISESLRRHGASDSGEESVRLATERCDGHLSKILVCLPGKQIICDPDDKPIETRLAIAKGVEKIKNRAQQ